MSRRRVGWRRTYSLLALSLIVLALLPGGATAGWTVAYNCCGYLGGYEVVGAGYNYWSNNRIWSDPGPSVSLWYYNSSGAVGYKSNTMDNPFVHNGGAFGYSIATCSNNTANDVNPASCQAYS